MKKLLVLLAFWGATSAFCQSPVIPTDTSKAKQGDIIQSFDVEVAPQFPGGESGLMKYVGENLRYPKKARRKGIQGRVVVTFVIEKDGSVSTVNVVKGVHPLLDNEAARIISAMPKWTPGHANGKPVKVRYTLPLTFRLD